MKKFIAVLSFLLLTSCVSAEAEVEVCKTDDVRAQDLELLQVDGTNQSTFFKAIDIADHIKDIDDMGTVSVSISKANIISLTGSLNWNGSIIIDLISNGKTIRLSETNIVPNVKTITLNVNKSIDLAAYMSNNKAQLRYTLIGLTPSSFNSNVCFAMKAEATKKLL